MTLSFLADENISLESADYLEALGYRCHSLRRDGPWRLSDREIVALAKHEGRVILTHDLDFGQIYYFADEVRGLKSSSEVEKRPQALKSGPE